MASRHVPRRWLKVDAAAPEAFKVNARWIAHAEEPIGARSSSRRQRRRRQRSGVVAAAFAVRLSTDRGGGQSCKVDFAAEEHEGDVFGAIRALVYRRALREERAPRCKHEQLAATDAPRRLARVFEGVVVAAIDDVRTCEDLAVANVHARTACGLHDVNHRIKRSRCARQPLVCRNARACCPEAAFALRQGWRGHAVFEESARRGATRPAQSAPPEEPERLIELLDDCL